MALSHSTAPTVFLAEDSVLMRDTIAELLAPLGFTIVGSGATPQACIDGIQKTQPDVVVLDGRLEGGTGMSVLRALQPLSRVAVVVFTNHAGPVIRRRFLAGGVHAVLDKNTEFGQLAQTVRLAWQTIHGLQ